MAAKILVTGATGSIGRALIRDLLNRGKEVRAGVHTPEKFEYIKTTGVELAHLEFGDNLTIDRALVDIDSLFLLTPFAREQVEYERRVVDRALLSGVKHVVKLSIVGAQDEPGTQFTRWHGQAENYLKYSGLPYTIIRSNIFMQNYIRFVQPTANFIYLPLDNALVSYVDVRNVAEAISEILIAGKEHFGKIYEITGPQSLSADDIAQILTSVTNHHISFINIPEETALHVLESIGTPVWMARGMLELYSLQRLGRNSFVSHFYEDLLAKKPLSFERFAYEFANVFKAIIQHEHPIHLI